jgi:integrase
MTKRFNAASERVKRAYFDHLRHADRKAESTIDGIRKAIGRFEAFTGFADFRSFSKYQAKGFKASLMRTIGVSGEPLSKATMLATLHNLKTFFKWLRLQSGFRSRVRLDDIEYFNVSERDTRAAKSPRLRPVPTEEQVRRALFAMPSETESQRRDRAVFTLVVLTGMRDAALVSLRLKHVDLERRFILQDPREVNTKFSKRIDTFFFPMGEDIEAIFEDWMRYLREVKLYGNEDPVFPQTLLKQNEKLEWASAGLEPKPWASATNVRRIFRESFERVALAYFNPHSIRNMLVQKGELECDTIEAFKAWSQNLGHSSVHTTLTSYGNVALARQGELVRSVRRRDGNEGEIDRMIRLLEQQKRGGRGMM